MSNLVRWGVLVLVLVLLVGFGDADPAAASSGSTSRAPVAADSSAGDYGFARSAEGVYRASNGAQALSCEVGARGITIEPARPSSPWKLGLRTRSMGREDVLPMTEPTVSVAGARATLDHGPLVEWIENRPAGIEQGWTIAERPPGEGALEIGLELGGGFELEIDPDGRSAVLVERNTVLRYGGLRAWDARGLELPARMVAGKGGPLIEVRDAGALYPLTVDPTLSWMVEADQAGANLGNSVASAGDVNGDGYDDVIVGAPYYTNGEDQEGRATLYLGSASGPSTTPAWTAEGNLAFASFGIDVASAGDVNGDTFADVIVGANFYANGEVDEGAVFVYHGSSSGLATTPAKVFEGDQEFASFGTAVEGVGDVNGDGFDDVFVGAPFYTNVELYEGRAFVYMGSASGLGSTPWTAECDQADAFLGLTGGAAGDVDGDTFDDVLVGANWFDDDQVDEGRVFLYMGSASGLETTPDWMEDGDQAGALFGVSVARAGDVDGDGFGDVLVGSLFDNGEIDEGRAYLYMGSASGLETPPAWTAETDQINAQLGVALSGGGDVDGDGFDEVLVGALRYDHGEINEGRVFLYRGSASGLATTPFWTAESDQGGALFGASTAFGDMNGDGYADLLIGASQYDNGEVDEGAAFLYLGVPHLVLAQQKISDTAGGFDGTLANGNIFGWALVGPGDVNGDGVLDLAVAARNDSTGGGGRGAVWILLMNPDGTVDTEVKIASGSGGFTGTLNDGDEFGASLTAPGDLNADGVPDLLVGAHQDDDDGSDSGSIWILYLDADGTLDDTLDHKKINASTGGISGGFGGTLDAGDNFGVSIQPLGDLDGAGPSVLALAVGASGDGDGGLGNGAVWILFLDASETVIDHTKISMTSGTGLTGPVTGAFGHGLANLGDLDGDGPSVLALAVGAPGADEVGNDNKGAVWIVFLNADGTVSDDVNISVDTGGFGADLPTGAFFGQSLASLGRLDGIGAANLAVAAPVTGGSGRGSVWILSLSSTGTALGFEEITEGVHGFTGDLDVGDNFGGGVGSVGDFDGDGRMDLFVGANGDDDGGTSRGAAYLLRLNDGSVSLAASTTWTGATDREWSDDTNWSNGEPDADTTAIIPDAATTPNDPLATNANESCDHLFIQAGGTVELAGGTDNLQIFGGATVLGPITGTGEVVFERAGTLAGDSTISAALGVRAEDDLALQGGSPADPLTITENLSGNADLEVRDGADVDVGVNLFALGNLVLDGALFVGGSLDVDGGLIESVAGEAGGGSLHVPGPGDCVEVGYPDYPGFVVSGCSMLVNGSSQEMVFDLDNGWPNSVVIDVAGTITILTQDLSIGGDLTLAQGTLSIGAGVETLTIGGDVTVDQGTLSVGANVEIEANAVVVEAGAQLDVTDRQLFIPAPIPVVVRGMLSVGPGGELLFESNTITVESGGTLRLAGGPGLARMSGFGSERYTLDLQAGSTLAANNFAFTQMSASGIVIANGVTIAASPLNLRNGVFDRPANGGVLLDVSRTLPTEFRYLRFENSGGAVGANNVHVPATSATITMTYWSGAFGGPAFEDDPGAKLDWGTELGEGVVASPKLGAMAPGPITLPLVVGNGGAFTTVETALRSLTHSRHAGRIALELAAGRHEPFELGPDLGVNLVLTGAPGAWIDATLAPVRIAGLPAERSVELVGLVLDASSAAGPALLVEEAKGIVLLDGVTVRGGAYAPAVLLSGASAVALQGGAITATSAVDLELERGSRASASDVEITTIALAGRSMLETRGMDVEPAVEPGSRWRRSAPAPLLRVNAAGVVALDAGAGTHAWLLASPQLGFAPAASERIAGTLLLDPRALLVLGVRVPASGRAAWTLGALHGDAPLQLQALVAGLGKGACAWSEVLSWSR